MLLLLACTSTATFSSAQREAAVAAAEEVDRARLMAHVVAMVALRDGEEPYYPPEARYEGMPHTHVGTAEYVADALAEAGLTPVVETSGEGERDVRSVVADIPGGSHGDEIVLVSAHHDAWFFGADDNATGVAVILEVARALADAAPDRTVRIASFDREEEGLVGAAEYARQHPDEAWHRVVNLDSVGYTDATPGSQQSLLGLDAPDTGDFLAVIAPSFAQEDLLASLALAEELEGPKYAGVVANGDSHGALLSDLLRSDHAPFWEMGVPGVFLTDTTEFRNPRYHTEEDTVDTLDADFLGEVGAFTAGLVAAFAEAG
ncbi:MAG: M28 family metallopeptidase [Myxococcota bacterium]